MLGERPTKARDAGRVPRVDAVRKARAGLRARYVDELDPEKSCSRARTASGRRAAADRRKKTPEIRNRLAKLRRRSASRKNIEALAELRAEVTSRTLAPAS